MTTDSETYLTLQEFSERTGLSLATVRRRIKDGSLPVWQPGGHRTAIRIPESVLLPLQRNTAATSPQSESSGLDRPSRQIRRPRWQQSHT